jgi:hypothetical protein
LFSSTSNENDDWNLLLGIRVDAVGVDAVGVDTVGVDAVGAEEDDFDVNFEVDAEVDFVVAIVKVEADF